jgi:hypothetical protein
MSKLQLRNAVKAAVLTIALTFTLAACKRSANEQPVSKESKEHVYCAAHSLDNDGCGPYKVLSFELKETVFDIGGTAYEFLLERDGVRIVADCAESRCSHWVKSVGKVVEGDGSLYGFISYHDNRCKDDDSLRQLLAGKNLDEVCPDQIMTVKKMEAMSPSR